MHPLLARGERLALYLVLWGLVGGLLAGLLTGEGGLGFGAAALLGFPNPIIGVAAFPVVVATGAALLAGGRLARWYWLGLQAGVTTGFAFICWLAFQSLYRIGALCPYCMVVWAVVIPLFWYVTARNVAAGALGAAPDGRLADGLRDWRGPLVFGTYLVVVLLVLERFWSYWSTLL